MSMVAAVTGYALQPPTDPNRIHLLDLPVTSIIGDIRDPEKLNAKTATEMTASWYKAFYQSNIVQSYLNLQHYISDASKIFPG